MVFNPIPAAFPDEIQLVVKNAVSKAAGISDAYLTRCSLPFENAPRLVLVVGVKASESIQGVAHCLIDLLDEIRWRGKGIDVLPFDAGRLPPAVLHSGLKL